MAFFFPPRAGRKNRGACMVLFQFIGKGYA